MIAENIIELTDKLEDIEIRFEEFEEEEIGSNEYENLKLQVYTIERDVLEYINLAQANELSSLQKIQEKIAQIKRNNDFFEEEAELDRLYPNRHEAGFDQTSMSFASVLREN
jgi:hypothetical protein